MVLQHRMAANMLCTVWACPRAALNAFWEPPYNHPPCPDTMPLNNIFCSMGALSVKCFVLQYTSVHKDSYCFFQGYSLSKPDMLWSDWKDRSALSQQEVERKWDKPQKGEQREKVRIYYINRITWWLARGMNTSRPVCSPLMAAGLCRWYIWCESPAAWCMHRCSSQHA